MVFGIVMMSAMVPTMIGLNEATKGTRDHEESRKAESRSTRSHLVATCDVEEGSQDQRERDHNVRIYLGQDQKVLYFGIKGIIGENPQADNSSCTSPNNRALQCPRLMDICIVTLLMKPITRPG